MSRRLRTPIVRKPDMGVFRSSPFELLSPRALMDALNTRVMPGRIEKVKGWTSFSPTVLPGTAMHADVAKFYSGEEILLVADSKRVYKFNTTTKNLDDITGADLTQADSRTHFSGMWMDNWIYTNALDVIKKWSGGGNIATLGGLTDAEPGGVVINTAKCLCPAGPFLLLGNTTEAGAPQPCRVRWNAFGVMETWKNDVSGNGQAGYMDVAEEPSEIMAIVPIGNFYAVYKKYSVQLMSYIGLPVVWARRQIVAGRGLMAPRAIVSLGDFHIGCFSDNFYIFNGASLQPIGMPIRDDFIASLNPNKKDLMFAFHAEDKSEVVFAYPGLNSDTPDKAIVYNYIQNAWTFKDFPFSCAALYVKQDTTTWVDLVGTWLQQTFSWDYRNFIANSPAIIVGDAANKKVFEYEVGGDKNGAVLSGYATTTLTDFGDPARMKRVFRLKPVCENLDADLLVSIITSDKPRGDINFNGPYSFNPSTDEFIDVDLVGRFFGFKIESPNSNGPFTLSGWEWEVEIQEDR